MLVNHSGEVLAGPFLQCNSGNGFTTTFSHYRPSTVTKTILARQIPACLRSAAITKSRANSSTARQDRLRREQNYTNCEPVRALPQSLLKSWTSPAPSRRTSITIVAKHDGHRARCQSGVYRPRQTAMPLPHPGSGMKNMLRCTIVATLLRIAVNRSRRPVSMATPREFPALPAGRSRQATGFREFVPKTCAIGTITRDPPPRTKNMTMG